jgi:hypothetical protein
LFEIDQLFSEPRASSEVINSQDLTQENAADVSTALFDSFTEPEEIETKVDEFDDEFDEELSFDVLELCSQSKYEISRNKFQGRGKVVEIKGLNRATVEDKKGEYHNVEIEPTWGLEMGDFIHSPPVFGSVPIAHSDTLVSCTGIATATSCPRQGLEK